MALTIDRDVQHELLERGTLTGGHPRAELFSKVSLVATLAGVHRTRDLESSAGQVRSTYVPGAGASTRQAPSTIEAIPAHRRISKGYTPNPSYVRVLENPRSVFFL